MPKRAAGRRQLAVAPTPAGGSDAGETAHPAAVANCCALCQRAVDRFTIHHLTPRARGGNHGPKARLCPTCHRQIHAMFSETTLAEELYSIALLRANPRVAAFLRWMRKQRGATFRVRRARERR